MPQVGIRFRDTAAASGTERIELGLCVRVLDVDVAPIQFHLVGEDHRERCENALTHFGFRNDQSGVAVFIDVNPRGEGIHARFFLALGVVLTLREGGGPMESDDQRGAAGGGSSGNCGA